MTMMTRKAVSKIGFRRLLLASQGSNLLLQRRTTATCLVASAQQQHQDFLSSSSWRQRQQQQQQQHQALAALPSARWLSTTTSTNNEDASSSDEKPIVEGTIIDDGTKIKKETKEKIEFKAETKEILNIMTNSLYTDKEVFLRELVSNASDALEKLRHEQTAGQNATIEPAVPLEIRIDIDELTSSITITDTGIGMTRQEMIDNLGTIARSGSRKFRQDLSRVAAGGELDPAKGIIGKFGVGFYSLFMISESVRVISKSALVEHADQAPQVWTSTGDGFEVGDVDDGIRVTRGTSVQMFVDGKFWHLVNEAKLEEIIKQYSRFVGFPIYLMGKQINTVQAIWYRHPKDVSHDDYLDFYKYITNAVDDPLDVIHFRAEAPLEVKALFFIPSFHQEKFGMARMEPAVNLYCRKVLIEAKSKNILPDWLRFLKGVVDSEDLPLAISREATQDSVLLAKLKRALTRKILAHLAKMQKNDEKTYVEEFYKEYASFLKEGICDDAEFQPQLCRLLYFETYKNPESKLSTFDEYISNMSPEQEAIYYLCAPTRQAALSSPYLESFTKAGIDVIFIFSAIDDFVMGNLQNYEGRKLVSVEKSDIDLEKFIQEKKKRDAIASNSKSEEDETGLGVYKASRTLTPDECVDLCNWFRAQLPNKVASCSITNRLYLSPAIVTDHESGALRRMMRMVDSGDGANRDEAGLPKQHVEINPSHPIIVGIQELRENQPVLAKTLAEQVFDNCLMAAGLMDDSRSILPRLNDLLICIVNGANNKQQTGTTPAGSGTTTKTEAATAAGATESSGTTAAKTEAAAAAAATEPLTMKNVD